MLIYAIMLRLASKVSTLFENDLKRELASGKDIKDVFTDADNDFTTLR
nr:hypothetical protein [uncultured Methanolobus sp.]